MINRRVEYLSATIMIGWAGLMSLADETSVTISTAFAPMIERGWTQGQLASILGVFGLVWIAALWVNGHYRRTPVVRCICAGGGTVMWSHVAVMLTMAGIETGTWSTGVVVYWPLALFDLASCYRSAADAYFAHLKGALKDEMAARQNEC